MIHRTIHHVLCMAMLLASFLTAHAQGLPARFAGRLPTRRAR